MIVETRLSAMQIPASLLNLCLVIPFLITAGCDPESAHDPKSTTSADHKQVRLQRTNNNVSEPTEGVHLVTSAMDPPPGKQIMKPFANVRVVVKQNPVPEFSTVTVFSGERRVDSYENYQFHKLYAFKYQDTGYIFIEMWEGGAHCCFPTTVYSVTGDGVRDLHTFELGHAYFDPERDLITRSGNLYYRMKDDRYAYYRVSFAASIFLDRYFRMTPHAITEANEQFRNAFRKKARQHRKRLMDIISMPEQKARSLDVDAAEEGWFPALLGYTVNMVMAGKQAEAWEGFDRLYGKIRSRHPSWLKGTEPGMLKEEIQSEISESEK